MSRTTALLVSLLAFVLLGLGAWRTVEALGRRQAASEETSAGPALVEVAPAQRRTLRDLVDLSGTLRPVNEVDISSDVMGRVLSVEAEIGDLDWLEAIQIDMVQRQGLALILLDERERGA